LVLSISLDDPILFHDLFFLLWNTKPSGIKAPSHLTTTPRLPARRRLKKDLVHRCNS
jgi:hypothetical protein